MRRAAPFILALVVWLLLVWPFESTAAGVRVQWVDVGAGLVFAALVSWVMRDAEGVHLWLNPLRYFWLVVYLVVLFAAIVRANLEVEGIRSAEGFERAGNGVYPCASRIQGHNPAAVGNTRCYVRIVCVCWNSAGAFGYCAHDIVRHVP